MKAIFFALGFAAVGVAVTAQTLPPPDYVRWARCESSSAGVRKMYVEKLHEWKVAQASNVVRFSASPAWRSLTNKYHAELATWVRLNDQLFRASTMGVKPTDSGRYSQAARDEYDRLNSEVSDSKARLDDLRWRECELTTRIAMPTRQNTTRR